MDKKKLFTRILAAIAILMMVLPVGATLLMTLLNSK